MGTPDIASRRWIWEQYESQVGADTVQTGGDAALVRIKGTDRALAMSTDCTPRYCYDDPVEAGKQAVAETWRKISAVGATPIAITNRSKAWLEVKGGCGTGQTWMWPGK